jgi:PAS domain S-box-containing protein
VQRDVTERRQAEAAQRQSDERYTELVDSTDVMVWEIDPQSMHTTFVSKRVETLLSYSQSAWLENPALWMKHVHPDDVDRVMAHFHDIKADGQSRMVEFRMSNAEGKLLWLRDRARLVATVGSLFFASKSGSKCRLSRWYRRPPR